MKQRIFYSDNGTLSDWTSSLNDYYSGNESVTFVAAEDAIYFGATLPFNHIYVRMGSIVNALTSAMSISLWDGSTWQAVAELTDNTSAGGATLSKSEFVEFVPDKTKSWSIDDTVNSSGTERVTGLGNVTVYDKYWGKITFSADLTANTTLSWMGNIFSNDNDFGSEFPDLIRTAVKNAFESGKTDWNEQHYVAAKIIIKDLINRNVIVDKNQILCREDLVLASVQKVASLIYNALGDDYVDQFAASEKEYNSRLAKSFVKVDNNANGIVDRNESFITQGRLYR